MNILNQALEFSSALEDDDIQMLKDNIEENKSSIKEKNNTEEEKIVFEWESK
jgi:hypothetical protein